MSDSSTGDLTRRLAGMADGWAQSMPEMAHTCAEAMGEIACLTRERDEALTARDVLLEQFRGQAFVQGIGPVEGESPCEIVAEIRAVMFKAEQERDASRARVEKLLDAMELVIRSLPGPAADKASALDAIEALRDTLDAPEAGKGGAA